MLKKKKTVVTDAAVPEVDPDDLSDGEDDEGTVNSLIEVLNHYIRGSGMLEYLKNWNFLLRIPASLIENLLFVSVMLELKKNSLRVEVLARTGNTRFDSV